jgi:chemotaxis protein CheX
MNHELFQPFLDATRSVFQLMLDMSDVCERPEASFSCDDELDIAIGVTGDLTGEVLYRFPRSTSLSMVAAMSGMEVDNVDEFVTSAISEVANIISGNVMTLLEGNALKCDILPPKMRPASNDGSAPDTARFIMTPVGDVIIDIRLTPAR